MKRVVVVDPLLCSGCRYCEMACSFKHEGVFSPALSRITVVREDDIGFDYPVVCRFCESCDALEACPTGAMRRVDGVVKVDIDKCVACGACVTACRYGAVKARPGGGQPIVCDLCGGDPVCVKRCPTRALAYSEGEDMSLPEAREYFIGFMRRLGANV